MMSGRPRYLGPAPAVATGSFRRVERLVSACDGLFHVFCRFDLGQAGADTQTQSLIVGQIHRTVPEGLQQPVGHGSRVFGDVHLDELQKLLAAETEDWLPLARLRRHYSGGMLQSPIANAMPVGVIDALEMIYVDHHQHCFLSKTLSACLKAPEFDLQSIPQRQSGEGIKSRAVREKCRLKMRQLMDKGDLAGLEGFKVGYLANTVSEYGGTQLAHRPVHELVLVQQTDSGRLVNLLETLAMFADPKAKSAAAMGVMGKDVLAGRRPQHRTPQNAAGPAQMCLDGGVQFANEFFNLLVKYRHVSTRCALLETLLAKPRLADVTRGQPMSNRHGQPAFSLDRCPLSSEKPF
jgi:hypothetical protein